jgi:RNA polymerase sigma factor (sigma-70 family)
MGENSEELKSLLDGCKTSDRRSQELLYKQYFGFAMGICLRYTKNRDEALEVLNDSFLKVFNKIDKFDFEKPFRTWVKRIVINTAIDNFRKQQKHYFHKDIDEVISEESKEISAIDKLNFEDLLMLIHKLPHAYQVNFNLFAIEGFKHEEIAEIMQISVGTSKSNVSRARFLIRRMLENKNEEKFKFL